MLHRSTTRSNHPIQFQQAYKEMNMSATAKSTKLQPETIDLTSCPAACATLYQKGLERAADATKLSLNLALQQNADILGAIKNALKGSNLPGLFVLDLAAQAAEGCVAVQKQLIDLALEQSNAAIQALQNLGQNAGDVQGDVAAAVQASLDRSVAAQNTVVEFVAKQSKAVSESVKAQPGVAGTAVETLTDSMQRSFDTVLGVQKEMLDIAVKPLKAAVVRA
jgi:hypothetical protein